MNFIKWPIGAKVNEVMNSFEEKRGIRGLLGATDGSLIPVKATSKGQQDYINRKRFHSTILQATVDADLLATDIYCGYPGCLHDARVFRNSPLYNEVAGNYDYFFHGNSQLVADSAHPLLKWVLTSFNNHGNLTTQQGRYNFKQGSTRITVQHFLEL